MSHPIQRRLDCARRSLYVLYRTDGPSIPAQRGVMNVVSFDVHVIPDETSVAAVFHVPPWSDCRAVEQLVCGLIYAFAVAERKTLDEMETLLATMMTITRLSTGTQIQLRRPCSDATYLDRFDTALCGQLIKTH